MKEFEVNRRDFLRLSGLATAGVVATACSAAAPAPSGEAPAAPAGGEAAAPAPAAPGGLRDVPREKTMIVVFSATNGLFTNVGIGNPYAAGFTGHRHVLGGMEPLFYYSAFADETIPWLATGAEYNADFTELVVNIREGVEWSDGTPFTAKDVAFTLNMLMAQAPKLRNSAEVQKWVKEASAVDDLTVKIVFNLPRPRFLFSHLTGKFDTGIYWVPEHIYKDVEDASAYNYYDLEKGLPAYTGPFKNVFWAPEQQIIDRRDDWWAAKTGFAELPAIERIIVLPVTGEERMAQLVINNEIDSSLDLRANTIKQVVDSNPAVITHTNRELPLGYIDWWPTSIWFNTSVAPWDTKETRRFPMRSTASRCWMWG
jgi:peptide/nickel transport system substrate-binding protein